MLIYHPKVLLFLLLFFGWRIWKCFFPLKFNSFYSLSYAYICDQFIKMSLWHFHLLLIVNKIMNNVFINNHDNKPIDANYVLDLEYDVMTIQVRISSFHMEFDAHLLCFMRMTFHVFPLLSINTHINIGVRRVLRVFIIWKILSYFHFTSS